VHGEDVVESGDLEELLDEAVYAAEAECAAIILKCFSDIDEIAEAHAGDVGEFGHVENDVGYLLLNPHVTGLFEVGGVASIHPADDFEDYGISRLLRFDSHLPFSIVEMWHSGQEGEKMKKLKINDVN
jgi:hypothetical protein